MKRRPAHRSFSPGAGSRALLLGLTFGLALAACGGPHGPSRNGPLGPPGNPTTTCTPLRHGEAFSDGYLSVKNNSSSTLTIERVALASPRNLQFLGAFIVPVTGNVIGDTDGWPPPAHLLLSGVMWKDRHRPAGARVRPGESIDSVVGLKVTPGHAKASDNGQLIYYHDASGHHYVMHSHIQVKLEIRNGPCPD